MAGRVSGAAMVLIIGFLGQAAHGQAGEERIYSGFSDRISTPGQPPLDELMRTDRILRTTVACVFKREPSRVKALLETAPGSIRETKLIDTFQSRIDNCNDTSQSIMFSQSLLRGAFAEIVYHNEFPEGLAPANPIAAETLATWAEPRLEEGGDTQLELLHSAARCLVAAQPAAMRALLATDPMSMAELKTMQTLRQALASCLFSGMKLTTSRQALRGLLAEAGLAYGRVARTS